MKIFKFGGATVKDAESIRKAADIIRMYPGDDLLVVVSAMGKTTNALEALIDSYFNEKEDVKEKYLDIQNYHLEVCKDLFGDPGHPAINEVNRLLENLKQYIGTRPVPRFDFEYDQIVCYGELISTTIVHFALSEEGIHNTWLDARNLISTDSNYRDAKVDWAKTSDHVARLILPIIKNDKSDQKIIITQGFIGESSNHHSTSLGREGSDFTAAIFANILDASDVTVWKDVPGILNADPRYFDDVVKMDRISYRDATEFSYYGAKVIHHKTIKPLQNKNIPLFVKCFYDPSAEGTLIDKEPGTSPEVPSFMVKVKQVLISLSSSDFSFIAVDKLHSIFGLFARHNMVMNVMQNSAISLSICVDYSENLGVVLEKLQNDFRVKYNENLQLITINRYTQELIEKAISGKEVLLIQKSRRIARIVVR